MCDVLRAIGYADVRRIAVTLTNADAVVEKIARATPNAVVLNLCDGTELDGYPGIGVTRAIERCGVKYTGSDARFLDITTSKPCMKRVMIDAGVPTSPFVEFVTLADVC